MLSSPLPSTPTGVASTAVNTPAIPTAPTVTAVLMNWHRPNNTQTILDAYTQMSSINEILLLMLRPATAFEYSHPKVRTLHNYSLNADHGLSLRFLGCLHARSDFVLIQDDDVMLDDDGIAAMLAAKVGHPRRLVGCCGRDWNAPRPSYIPLHVDPGPARIVLTIAMLTHRGACADFWGQRLLMEDVAALGTPRWNGEDIFFSLVTFKSSGELPEVVGFNYTQLSEAGGGIHYGKGHVKYRSVLLRLAVKRLGLMDLFGDYVARPVTGIAKKYAPKLTGKIKHVRAKKDIKTPRDKRLERLEAEAAAFFGDSTANR
ncbi:MAG: hypothetical protein WDW36_005661 [Sanguina aurantia]